MTVISPSVLKKYSIPFNKVCLSFPYIIKIFLCRRSPAAGGIMLSGCPSIRLAVRLSSCEWEGKAGRGVIEAN